MTPLNVFFLWSAIVACGLAVRVRTSLPRPSRGEQIVALLIGFFWGELSFVPLYLIYLVVNEITKKM